MARVGVGEEEPTLETFNEQNLPQCVMCVSGIISDQVWKVREFYCVI